MRPVGRQRQCGSRRQTHRLGKLILRAHDLQFGLMKLGRSRRQGEPQRSRFAARRLDLCQNLDVVETEMVLGHRLHERPVDVGHLQLLPTVGRGTEDAEKRQRLARQRAARRKEHRCGDHVGRKNAIWRGLGGRERGHGGADGRLQDRRRTSLGSRRGSKDAIGRLGQQQRAKNEAGDVHGRSSVVRASGAVTRCPIERL